MITLNKFKRKVNSLIERIKLSESNYLDMKAKAQMYEDMMSAITYNLSAEYEEIIDILGNVVARIYKDKIVTWDVDIIEMLAAGGITFDKNAVRLNVIGFKKEED